MPMSVCTWLSAPSSTVSVLLRTISVNVLELDVSYILPHPRRRSMIARVQLPLASSLCRWQISPRLFKDESTLLQSFLAEIETICNHMEWGNQMQATQRIKSKEEKTSSKKSLNTSQTQYNKTERMGCQ